jgi:hypothetical protein
MLGLHIRFARWYIFKQKIPIWVNFGGSCIGRCWYILWPFGIFTAIWYILWPFGIFYGHLVYIYFPVRCNKKNLATLLHICMYVCMYVCTNLQRMIKFFCTPQWALSGEVKQFHGVVIFGFICCTLPTAATDQGRNQNRPWGQT